MKINDTIEQAYLTLDVLFNRRMVSCIYADTYCDLSIDTGDFILCDKAIGDTCKNELYALL